MFPCLCFPAIQSAYVDMLNYIHKDMQYGILSFHLAQGHLLTFSPLHWPWHRPEIYHERSQNIKKEIKTLWFKELMTSITSDYFIQIEGVWGDPENMDRISAGGKMRGKIFKTEGIL